MTNAPRVVKYVSVAATGLALFAAAVGVAGAQRGGPPPTGGPQPGRGDAGAAFGQMGDAYISDLATNLGVSDDDLRAAMAQTRQDMQPMMQQQMDEMRQRMQEHQGDRPGRDGSDDNGGGRRPFSMQQFGQGGPGGPGAPGGRGMAMREHMMGMMNDVVDTVAGALNMSSDDLHQQLQSGQSVADIARAQGKDPDALADQITNTLIQQHQGQLRDMIRQGMDRQFGRQGPRHQDDNN